MKKAFGQTVRDLKREVNKKVLKVPGIEQKILDATSNEPWGPHGSYLTEIAQATRNYHEYQLIMSVIWKRINDTGKNWRHVYKGLTVLEYLVAHGSERVIDDIKEHAYQISTLSDFQYIDSRGRDQGNNVRKKSQSIVALVNDKERIQEIREKALANKDKYQSTFATSGMHRSSSGGGYSDRYDDDRYDGRYRDEDQNAYSRERDGGNRDDDRYGRNRDSYNHDGDRYGRDPDRYGRDDYRDKDRQGRSRNDDYQSRSRSTSLDRNKGHSFDDDDRHSSRSSGGRVVDSSHDDGHPGKKLPERSVGAPPSYEEVVNSAQVHIDDERDEKASAVITDFTEKVASPPPKVFSESANSGTASVGTSVLPNKNEDDSFDEFDPRSSMPATANNVDMDLFGSFSVDDSMNSLALVPVAFATTTLEADKPIESGFSNNYMGAPSASTVFSQPNGNPFEDAPFRASSQDNFSSPSQNVTSFVSSQTSLASANGSVVQPISTMVEPSTGFDFGESFKVTNAPSTIPNQQPAATQYVASPQVSNYSSTVPNFQHPPATPMVPNQPSSDMLDSIFNLSSELAPPVSSSSMPPAPTRSMTAPPEFLAQPFLPQSVPQEAALNQFVHPGIQPQAAAPNSFPHLGMPTQTFPQNNFNQPGFPSTRSSPDLLSPSLLGAPLASQATPSASALPPSTAQSKEKFNTKSTVWADTLSRGLIDLNISGSTTVDIGVDFDSINRRDKLKEKKNISATPVSTITMGKAMGSGSGIGRSGVSALAPPANLMMAPRMGMSMGGRGMGMGAYGGGMDQSMSMGGYAGVVNQPMGIGMNVEMGQGAAMRPGSNMPQSQGVPGVGYNPMMGMGGYGPQHPYGGYR